MYDLGRLELTVIAGQFGLLCREAYRKVSKLSKQTWKLAIKQASMQVNEVHRLIVLGDM